jgi:hypothetical protein
MHVRRLRSWSAPSVALILTLAVPAQDFHDLSGLSLAPSTLADWRAVAAGDVDGDGRVDLVFACFGEPGIGQRNFWLRNDGTGWFTPGSTIALAPSLSRDVVLGDFDGDGDLDVFFANQRLDAICRNDGAGGFALHAAALPPLDVESRAVRCGDIDGDGDLDLVVATGGFDVVYRNNGDGTFVDASVVLPQVWAQTDALELADFDGDGDLDVLLVHRDAPSRLLWNDGAGGFTAGPTFPAGSWITSGDVDGDGDLDFVLTNVWTGQLFGTTYSLTLFRNEGGGAFAPTPIPVTSLPFVAIVTTLVDLDGDGARDLVLVGQGVRKNDGAGNFAPIVLPQPQLGRTFVDIDGDGDLDLVGVPTLRNDGTGRFDRTPIAPILDGDQGSVVALVDFDGDQHLDLVLQQLQTLRVLGNDGRGVFRDTLAATTNNSWSNSKWLSADWTGDGRPDLMQPYTSIWYENVLGSGLVARALPSAVFGALTLDVDGDQDLDLVAQSAIGVVQWFANQGGTFAPGAPVGVGMVARLLLAADVDGDGRDDVVYRTQGGAAAWLRCTGSAVFAPGSPAFPPGLSDIGAVAVADFDGDGVAEVVLGRAGFGTPQVTLLTRQGGAFVVAGALPASGLDGVSEIVPIDADRDGDLDLLVVPLYSGGAARLLRNDGGHFVEAAASGLFLGLPRLVGVRVFAGDLDRDGDADLVAAGSPSSLVLTNLHGQLLAREAPTIGTTWRLEVTQRPIGTSLGAVFVGLAAATPGIPTPFGTLHVDPFSGALFGGVLVASPEPVVVFDLPLPPDPAIVGTALYAQHVVVGAGGIRLGNDVRVAVR